MFLRRNARARHIYVGLSVLAALVFAPSIMRVVLTDEKVSAKSEHLVNPSQQSQSAIKLTFASGADLENGPVGRAAAQVLRAVEQHYLEPERLDYNRLLTVGLLALAAELGTQSFFALVFEDANELLTESDVDQCLTNIPKQIDGSDVLFRCFETRAEIDPRPLELDGKNQQIVFLLGSKDEGLAVSLPKSLRPSAALSRVSSSLMEWMQIRGFDSHGELLRAYLNALLHELDPHSSFLNVTEYEELRSGTRGQFGGVGVVISDLHGLAFVREIIPNSPAQMAGIEPNDIILRVGENSVAFQGIDVALKQIRTQSASGNPVQIWVFRPHSKRVFSTFISREYVPTVSVEERNIPEAPEVLHLRVTGFSSRTSQEIYDAYMSALKRKKGLLDAMILDLRGNPGGLLDQAIQVSDLFLSEGKIVETRSRYESETEEATTEQLISLPLIVLINSSSASASEIVAGALKDSGRALLIGEQSYGKGSVQSLFEVPDYGALKLTVAHYLTPSGASIQNRGVQPQVIIRQVQLKDRHIWVSGSSEEKREQDLSRHLRNPTLSSAENPDESTSWLVWAKTSEAFSEEIFPGHVAFTFPNEENADRVTNPSRDGPVRVALRLIQESRKTAQGAWSLPQLPPAVFETVFREENQIISDSLGGSRGQDFGSFFKPPDPMGFETEPWAFVIEERFSENGRPSFIIKGRFHDRAVAKVFASLGIKSVLVGFSPTGETEQPSLWHEVPLTLLPVRPRHQSVVPKFENGLSAVSLEYDFSMEFEVPSMFWTAWSALEGQADRDVDIAVRLSPFGAPIHIRRWKETPKVATHGVRILKDEIQLGLKNGGDQGPMQTYTVRLFARGQEPKNSDRCHIVLVPLLDRSKAIITEMTLSRKRDGGGNCVDAEISIQLANKNSQAQIYGGILGALVMSEDGFITSKQPLFQIGPRGIEQISP